MSKKTNNKELSELQRMLKTLNSPYKKSKAYETFGDVEPSSNKLSVFWNSRVDYVVKYENAKIDNIDEKLSEENITDEHKENDILESEDKNIPLMEPTFFDKNDPNNPKYVSLEEKKENLERKKLQSRSISSDYIYKSICSIVPSVAIGFLLFLLLMSNYNSLDDISIVLSAVPAAAVMAAPFLIISSKGQMKIKKLAKEINDLEKEIEEVTKIKKQNEKSKAKEKLKLLSKETKKVLSDISKNEELNDTKKAFGMSYEEFLRLYEISNGFQDEEEMDKAIESLGIITENEDVIEKSTTKKKRYKITGRKK